MRTTGTGLENSLALLAETAEYQGHRMTLSENPLVHSASMPLSSHARDTPTGACRGCLVCKTRPQPHRSCACGAKLDIGHGRGTPLGTENTVTDVRRKGDRLQRDRPYGRKIKYSIWDKG